MLMLYKVAVFMLIMYPLLFFLQWIIKKQIKILLFVPVIGFAIISLYFVALLVYSLLSGSYEACQVDPECMDEATGFWIFAAFLSFATAVVLTVISIALNGLLRRFQHATLQ